MFAVQSLDDITEGSTLLDQKTKKQSSGMSFERSSQPKSDFVGDRVYKNHSMDRTFYGHKDSKNKRLTVRAKEVHTMRHSSEKNHSAGDYRSHVSMSKVHGDAKRRRKVFPHDTQPGGCNGPVMCNTGKAFQKSGVITQHDPQNPVHAATQKQFTHGGVQFKGEISMMGASNTLPTNNPENAALNNAAGLHYAINIGKGDAIGQMQNQNFMQQVAGQRNA